MAHLLDFTHLPVHSVVADFPGAPDQWAKEFNKMSNGVRIDTSIAPREALVSSGHKKLPSFFQVRGCLICDERFKNCIEKIEPKKHQFSKIEFYKRGKKEILDGEYYLFNILILADTFDIEKCKESGAIVWNESLSFLESIYTRDLRVTMMKERCQGFHVWRGDSLFRKSIFASDGIVADMKKEKLTGIAYKALAEI